MKSSASHVAFLRAINVGGRRIIAMEDLTSAFTSAGCTGVRSVIQSGNVLFTPPPGANGVEQLTSELHRRFGELALFYRTVSEIDRLVGREPFKSFTKDRMLKLYVAFLAQRPRRRTLAISSKERLEVIAVTQKEAFIVSRRKPNGFYGFPNNFVEAALGVSATTRNWSTVLRIAQLARDVPA